MGKRIHGELDEFIDWHDADGNIIGLNIFVADPCLANERIWAILV